VQNYMVTVKNTSHYGPVDLCSYSSNVQAPTKPLLLSMTGQQWAHWPECGETQRSEPRWWQDIFTNLDFQSLHKGHAEYKNHNLPSRSHPETIWSPSAVKVYLYCSAYYLTAHCWMASDICNCPSLILYLPECKMTLV
jgi:hypothetical protein